MAYKPAAPAPAAAPDLLTIDDVTQRYQLSGGSVYKQVRLGKMPAPVKIGAVSRWHRSELEAWAASLSRYHGSPVQARASAAAKIGADKTRKPDEGPPRRARKKTSKATTATA